jgi:hypothetical protein
MASRLQPALWGGLFIGVLSALPFVSNLNACCCLWVVVGGVLTAYLLQERTAVPITAGDGAVAGLLAGAIGAVIMSVAGGVISALGGMDMQSAIDQMLSGGDLPPQFSDALERAREIPAAVWFLITMLIALVVYPIFAMLGALLGVAIFKKRLPPPPPAPPPQPGTIEVLPPE